MNQTVKLMSALIMGCISMPALATESGDTLVVEKPNRVKIETRNDQQRIVVIGSKEDKAFLYTQRIALKDSSDVKKSIENARDFNKVVIKKNGKSTKWSSSAHVFLGLNVMTDVPDGYKFKTWFSPEIGVALMADWHPFGKKNEWSVGLGVDFKHYSNSSSSYWAKGPNAANPAAPINPLRIKFLRFILFAPNVNISFSINSMSINHFRAVHFVYQINWTIFCFMENLTKILSNNSQRQKLHSAQK